MSEQVEAHILKRYTLVKKVGSGAYGHVWKVTQKKTGNTMALKKIFDAFQHSTDAQRTYRQIVFLHELDHPNIIKLHAVHRAENDKDLYLVFEYMEADLHNAIGQKILKDIHNRFIIYQLVKGIKFLHSAELLHRDLKPSNVLLNSDCVLKICDFGLARSLVVDKEGTDVVLTQEVATRWYRAPQVLLGSQTYDKSADVWSIGCILAEMITGKPFFPGNSTLNQLQKILSFTGKPKKQDVNSLNSEIASTMIDSISQIKTKNAADWFKTDTPPEAINLISQMLTFNPNKRITINQILRHPYLSKFHNSKQQYECGKVIHPPISDNTKLNLKQYRQLIYDRIRKIYKQTDPEREKQKFCSEQKVSNLNSHLSNSSNNAQRKSRENLQNSSNNASSVKNSRSSIAQPITTHHSSQHNSSQVGKQVMTTNNYYYVKENKEKDKVNRKQSHKSFQSDHIPSKYQNSQSQQTYNLDQQTINNQKSRPSSAIKQDNYTNNGASSSLHQYGYIQRSSQNQSTKLKNYFDSEQLRKKNSLKDIKNKRPTPSNSFKQETSSYHHYSYSNGNKPSTATNVSGMNGMGYIPNVPNSISVNSGHLNKFYKSPSNTSIYKENKVPIKY